MNEKNTILTPFDVTSKMLGPYMFCNTARETLGDKIEMYFYDHSFVPLFIQVGWESRSRVLSHRWMQENYLKTQPAKTRDLTGPPKILKHLELMDKAASSISDADLVDALIHGFVSFTFHTHISLITCCRPEQHWSLMPLHAVCSTVRPASFIYGGGMGYSGANGISFSQ